MPTYVFYAARDNVRRFDGCNTVVAHGDDAEAARAAAEQLVGENPGAFDDFEAVELTDDTPPFVVQGHPPVGSRSQSTWLTLGRGGDSLRGS